MRRWLPLAGLRIITQPSNLDAHCETRRNDLGVKDRGDLSQGTTVTVRRS